MPNPSPAQDSACQRCTQGEPRLYTRAEVAKLWSVTEFYVDQKIRSGDLGAVKIGSRNIRIPASEVERATASLPAYEPAS